MSQPKNDERMRHDYPILQQFHTKHALGALAAPSCLCCGQQTHPVTRPIAVQHMELPAIVICKQCKDAATGATACFKVSDRVLFRGIEHEIFANGDRPGTFDICQPGWPAGTDRWLNVPPNQLSHISGAEVRAARQPAAWRDAHDHATLYYEHPGAEYEVEPLYLAPLPAPVKPCCGFPVGGPCPDCPDAASVATSPDAR